MIGKDELGLDPSTVGAISALEGLFALSGALVLARITPPHMFRIPYLGGVAVLFCFIILIGWFSGAWVLALGRVSRWVLHRRFCNHAINTDLFRRAKSHDRQVPRPDDHRHRHGA